MCLRKGSLAAVLCSFSVVSVLGYLVKTAFGAPVVQSCIRLSYFWIGKYFVSSPFLQGPLSTPFKVIIWGTDKMHYYGLAFFITSEFFERLLTGMFLSLISFSSFLYCWKGLYNVDKQGLFIMGSFLSYCKVQMYKKKKCK